MVKRVQTRRDTQEISGAEVVPERFNFAELLAFFSSLKAQVEQARQNDGRVDAQEWADIINAIVGNVEKMGVSSNLGQKIQQAKKKYEGIVAMIDSTPALSQVLRGTYPAFFTLFQEQGVQGGAEAPVAPHEAVGGTEPLLDPEEMKPLEIDSRNGMSLAHIDALNAFVAHDFFVHPDPVYGEEQLRKIAEIIAHATRDHEPLPDGLLTRARAVFTSQMPGGMSPEEALQNYADSLREQVAPAAVVAESASEGPLSVMAEEVADEEGQGAHQSPAPVLHEGGETEEEKQERLATRISSLLLPLSRQDAWRDDVHFSIIDEQASLHDFDYDFARSNYLRQQLLHIRNVDDVLFTQLLDQGIDRERTSEILANILYELSSLTEEERKNVLQEEEIPEGLEGIGDVIDGVEVSPAVTPLRRMLTIAPSEMYPDGLHADVGRAFAALADKPPAIPRGDVDTEEMPLEGEPVRAARPLSRERARRLATLTSLPDDVENVSSRLMLSSRDSAREPGPTVVVMAGQRVDQSDQKKNKGMPTKEGLFSRMRQWGNKKTDDFANSDLLRVHVQGELTQAEIAGSAPTLSRSAMIAGAFVSGAMSRFGVALPLDAFRYATQRYFVGKERDELAHALREAAARERLAQEGGHERDRIRERNEALLRRVDSSRYLTESQKHILKAELLEQMQSFVDSTSPRDEHLHRETGRILNTAIRTRISGEKVVKEALNTTLMLSGTQLMLSGAQFLRAPAYGAISLYEQWNRLTREAPESKAGDRLRLAVTGGFDEWWDKAKGNKGRLAQAAAFGTAARFVGMSATFVESVASSGIMDDMLHAWEQREALYPAGMPDFSHTLESIKKEIHDRIESFRSSEAPALSESHASEAPVAVPEIAYSAQADVAVTHEAVAPAAESILPSDIVLFPDRIPAEAIISASGKNNGITQALLAAVEAHPNLLHTAEQGALRDDYTAALLMRRLAAKDGLLDYWVNAKAIGKLAIIPKYEGDGVHIAFLNPTTGTEYSVAELKALGWLTKAKK